MTAPSSSRTLGTRSARKRQTRSVCAVWSCRLRALGDMTTRHTLRSFTHGTRHSLRARREVVPPACPRRHDHTAQTLRSFTRGTRHSLRVRPMTAPIASRTLGTHSARSTSPPPRRSHRRVCCPLRWAQRRRDFASLPRLLKKRFSLGATHPALIVYRLAPSPCGMTAASHARLLGRGFPEPPPPLVAAWLALSPCGLVGLLLLLVSGRRFASWRNPRRRPPVAGSAPFPQTRRLGPRSPPFATLRPRRGRRGQGTKVAGAPAPGFFIGWRGRCQCRAGGCPAAVRLLRRRPAASAPNVASAPAIFTARSRNV